MVSLTASWPRFLDLFPLTPQRMKRWTLPLKVVPAVEIKAIWSINAKAMSVSQTFREPELLQRLMVTVKYQLNPRLKKVNEVAHHYHLIYTEIHFWVSASISIMYIVIHDQPCNLACGQTEYFNFIFSQSCVQIRQFGHTWSLKTS